MRFTKTVGVGLVALSMTGTAEADPVLITSGAFFLDFEGDWMTVSGPGFSLSTASAGSGIATHIPMSFRNLCFPCQAGDVLDLSISTTGGEQAIGVGPATFGGKSYAELFYRAELSFIGTPQTFPDVELSFTSSQPFVFTGFLRAFLDSDFSTLVFSTALSGRGRAHGGFFSSDEGHFPALEHTFPYVFEEAAAVPEPATLLMIGVGLAGIGLRRARQNHRAHLG
jgi:hypothetical protein